MATIATILDRFNNLDIENVAEQSIDETKDVIADLNAEQLFRGKRSDGADITPEYSPATVAIKKEKGQVYDRVTLKDTGAFYAGLRVEVSAGKVVINSSDEKNDQLFKKYSTQRSNIFGLSDLFKREYLNEALKKAFRKNVKEATGL